MGVDPVTTEVIRGALTYAAEEMGIALRNAAYSPNIKERMDHSCTIFDGERRLAAQAEHIPVHLGSMKLAVDEGLRRFREGLEKGDMLLFNDPYISGTHLPDLTLVAPVFYRGEVAAYTASKAHHADVGGMAPGSMAAHATELYGEGLIIPPLRIMKHGRLNQELLSIILSNVRTPRVTLGDLRAQVAANLLGGKRVVELITRYGLSTFQGAVERILAHSERALRAGIRRMPEGAYEAEDWLEGTGVSEEPVKIRVRVTVGGSSLKVDYSGTSGQVPGPVNAVWGVTLAGVFYTIKCATDPEIPVNDGFFRPVHAYAPEGTLVNPTPPAPVAGGNVETSQRNVDALMKAFSQICPERVCAACQGTMNNVLIGGYDEDAGLRWTYYETVGGGYGGRLGLDGENGVQCHMTNTMNTPVEALETSHPLRVLSYTLRRDSGGPGRWRGGSGVERSFTLLSSSATLSVIGERGRIPPWGLFGGGAGATSKYLITHRDGSTLRLSSKATVKIQKGDVVTIRTPGGGGYGEPLDRDAERVLRDVLDGIVSPEEAEARYGVAIDGRSLKVDQRRTLQHRRHLLRKGRTRRR